jgi:hypothetical protein
MIVARHEVPGCISKLDGSATQRRVFNRFNLQPGLGFIYGPGPFGAQNKRLSPRIVAYSPFGGCYEIGRVLPREELKNGKFSGLSIPGKNELFWR